MFWEVLANLLKKYAIDSKRITCPDSRSCGMSNLSLTLKKCDVNQTEQNK